VKIELQRNAGDAQDERQPANVRRLHNPSLFVTNRMRPLSIVRNLIDVSRSYGSNSISYHLPPNTNIQRHDKSRFFVASRKSFPLGKRSVEQARSVGSCYGFIIKEGHPVALHSMIPGIQERAPEVSDDISKIVKEKGLVDEYMVPVFGAFNTRAVISFGFPFFTSEMLPENLSELTIAATIAHNQLVRFFGKSASDVHLSERERAVISWVAKGKSNNDIATILNIRPSSVDTYTRRIFKKLGVNDRISAAMHAAHQGVLDY